MPRIPQNQGSQLDTVLALGEIGNISPNSGSKWSTTTHYFVTTLMAGNNWEIMNEMYTKFFDEFKV
jgi:hypothetical protein